MTILVRPSRSGSVCRPGSIRYVFFLFPTSCTRTCRTAKGIVWMRSYVAILRRRTACRHVLWLVWPLRFLRRQQTEPYLLRLRGASEGGISVMSPASPLPLVASGFRFQFRWWRLTGLVCIRASGSCHDDHSPLREVIDRLRSDAAHRSRVGSACRPSVLRTAARPDAAGTPSACLRSPRPGSAEACPANSPKRIHGHRGQ